MDEITEKILMAASEIERSDAILICAGAGMGVDSGLPDFRGNEGFWNAYPPYRKLGLSFYQMADPEVFDSDPSFAWGFYGHRLNLYRETRPHEGFLILRKWTEMKDNDFFIFTSNVDGHFQASGFSKERIEECHGSIHFLQCTSTGCSEIWEATEVHIEVDMETMRASGPLPVCARCGSVARPNILMFGDWNWLANLTHDQHSRMIEWRNSLQGKKIVILEMGAGTAVPTVRHMSEKFLDMFESTLIRINKREPFVPPGNIGICAGALEVLKRIDGYVFGQTS